MGWIGYNFKENFVELHVFMHASSFVSLGSSLQASLSLKG